MRPCRSISAPTGLFFACAFLAMAGDPKETPAAAPRIFTNDDLKSSEGNLTYSEPWDESSYEAMLPREKPAADAAARKAEMETLKARYKELQSRVEAIEEVELPEAAEAAKREVRRGLAVVNGVPTVVLLGDEHLPAHQHLRALERELAEVNAEGSDIESRGHKLGMGRPALMQR